MDVVSVFHNGDLGEDACMLITESLVSDYMERKYFKDRRSLYNQKQSLGELLGKLHEFSVPELKFKRQLNDVFLYT